MNTEQITDTLKQLRINHVESPLALDDPHPSFSWQMESARTGARQVSYRILVICDKGLMWDSGLVDSDSSVGITYPAEARPLEPETDYRWQLTVRDETGADLTAEAAFSTGLMSRTVDDWHGAFWIGPDEMYLAAETLPVFRLHWRMRIAEGGSSAGIVFGASDPRLNAPTKNNYLIGGENYIACRLDVSHLPATVSFYRKGYAPGETVLTPFEVISVPAEVLGEAGRFEDHIFEIVVSGNQMEIMTMDGSPLETSEENRLLLDNPRRPVKERTHLILNPLKAVLDVPIYPRLCQVGFVTDDTTAAVFTDFAVHHYGGSHACIFGHDTGATYAVFQGRPGLTVSGRTVTAAPGTLAYADPSHASLPMLRREFTAGDDIVSAKLYAAAWGIYELTINGQKVGNEYLASGDMDFRKRLFYTAYDITDQVSPGANAVGATLASGWFGDQICYDIDKYNWYGDRQALLALAVIRYADGSVQYVPTDDSWQYYGQGPVRYAGNFNGEIYDAKREAYVEGWDKPGFRGEGWRAPARMGRTVLGYEPVIEARMDPGITQVEVLDAVFHSRETRGRDKDTVFIYDMGVNMVGIPRITFPVTEAGRQVTIRYSEILYPRLAEDNPYYYGDLGGMILTENLRGALVTDRYTMKGTPDEVFMPLFTFHGYRYVEISGLEEPLPADCIKGIVLSSVRPASRYTSSNPLTNRLFDNIIRSTLGNFLSIPTDCPQRDERLGWAGDAQVYSEAATYMADVSAFYRNYNQLQRDAQAPDGTFHLYVPPYAPMDTAFALGYTWNAAGVVIPWQTFLQYGDTATLRDNYPSIKRHVEGMMEMKADGRHYLTSHIGFLGDHLALDPSDVFLMDNAQFYRSMRIAESAALLLGETEDASRFKEYGDGLQEEWNKVFVGEDHRTRMADGQCQDTQASYALPLMCGVFSEDNIPHARRYLREACERTGYTMTTGFMGTGPLLPALTEGGDLTAAYEMFEQTGYPSWLYPVVNGATTVWERWNSYTIENGFAGNNYMNSFNHYSLGAVASWMMEYQAGIQRDGMEGFHSFLLQPTPGGHFTHVSAAYDSVYGTIESEWTAEAGKLTSYRALIPANTSARLFLPVSQEAAEGFCDMDGASFLGMEAHNGRMTAVFSLSSGTFRFTL